MIQVIQKSQELYSLLESKVKEHEALLMKCNAQIEANAVLKNTLDAKERELGERELKLANIESIVILKTETDAKARDLAVARSTFETDKSRQIKSISERESKLKADQAAVELENKKIAQMKVALEVEKQTFKDNIIKAVSKSITR